MFFLLILVPPNAEKVNYRLPGFLGKFLELQQVMWTTNAGLTDRHTFDSRPDSWPRLRRGIVSVFSFLGSWISLTDVYFRISGSRTTVISTSLGTL